jgi:FMN phosphatase YigB (HAD superfamily)
MAESPRIKAVVFDLGGVLLDLHAVESRRELVERYGLMSPAFSFLTRSSFESYPRSITELAMTGKVDTAEYLDAFLGQCSLKDADGLRINRLAVVGRERPEAFALVRQLKEAGIICGVLSNTIALHWEKLTANDEYPSLGIFDQVFASHLIECAKPELAAFSFVANALKLRMSECLLIDDTLLNVRSAEAAGWRALLFTDVASLQRDLDLLLPTR